jgi:hypothetical protein
VLTVVSGENQQPLGDARLVLGSTTYVTDSSGQTALRENVAPRTFLDILAPGFLDRNTSLSSAAETRFSLWPRTHPNGLNEDFTARIVYTWVADGSPVGGQGMYRLNAGLVTVAPSAEIQGNVRAMRILEESVRTMNDALGGEVTYQVAASEPPGGVKVEVLIDPDTAASNFAGTWRLFASSWVITGARVTYRSLANMDSRLMLHLLGHSFGLMESPDESDRMNYSWWTRRREDFSLREVLTMKLMLQRRAGNRWPDSDRAIGGAATAVMGFAEAAEIR